MKTKKRTSKAFTLAEILITLSIIGVVAALTIPTLIQRTGNEEYVSRLNKAYSTLSQATEAIMTEQGAAAVWASSVDNIYNAYKDHLRNAKECSSASGCFKSMAGSAKRLDGQVYFWNWDTSNSKRKLILADGTNVLFSFYKADCSGTDEYFEYKNACGAIFVDINGEKKPNQWGRDIFGFELRKNGLYPNGVNETDSEYKNTCSVKGNDNAKSGYGCAARVIAEGDMNY